MLEAISNEIGKIETALTSSITDAIGTVDTVVADLQKSIDNLHVIANAHFAEATAKTELAAKATELAAAAKAEGDRLVQSAQNFAIELMSLNVIQHPAQQQAA